MSVAPRGQSDYGAVVGLLGSRTGLSFAPNRYDNVTLGIRRAMSRVGMEDPKEYHRLIESSASALDDLIIELTVGETYFFREPGQFDQIRRVVLPDVRRRRGERHTIRAWSAGCASGEEAYSLAILFEQEGLAGQTHILATDISRAALAKARQATYSAWSLRGEEAQTARPYLSQQGDRYTLCDQIRRRVAFEYLNLAMDPDASAAIAHCDMDLILCRNVLIYFNPQTIVHVSRRLYRSLAEGGWLITGPSDPLLSDHAPFETVSTDAGLFYRRRSQRMEIDVTQAVSQVPSNEPCRVDHAEPRRSPAEESELGRRAVAAPVDLLPQARAAFDRCDYRSVLSMTATWLQDVRACSLHIRALANVDAAVAERTCRQLADRHPLATELRYLHAVLLIELDRHSEAAQAARQLIYLDRSLAMAHFTLGSILRRAGDRPGSIRAFRNARNLARSRPADEPVPLSDGEPATRLADAADLQLSLLNSFPHNQPANP